MEVEKCFVFNTSRFSYICKALNLFSVLIETICTILVIVLFLFTLHNDIYCTGSVTRPVWTLYRDGTRDPHVCFSVVPDSVYCQVSSVHGVPYHWCLSSRGNTFHVHFSYSHFSPFLNTEQSVFECIYDSKDKGLLPTSNNTLWNPHLQMHYKKYLCAF